MNVTIERRKLIDVLSLGGSLAGRSKVMEILNYAKVKIKGNKMIVSSTDNQGFIANRTDLVNSVDEVEFLIEPNLVLKAIKTLKEEQLTLNITDNKVVIKRERGVMQFPINSTDEYITFETSNDVRTYEIDSEKLFEWCNNAKNFVATDNLKPIMNGMLLYAKGNEIGCCATDANKLYNDYYFTDTEVNDELSAVIPTTALSLVCQVIDGTTTAQISVDYKNITIKGIDAKLSVRLVEGTYPKFKAVIPTNNDITISTDKNELIDCISRVSLFASATPVLRIDVKGMNMNLECEDITMARKGSDDTIVEHYGNDITIGGNCEYLLLCLRSVLADNVTIEMKDATRPIVIKDADRQNKTIVCMPVMIN